jgi:hypothetical protein
LTASPFSHIGGSVIADHGPVALVASRALARFYEAEARIAAGGGAHRWAERCARRALALAAAARAAARWRRAAGWADPDAADS